ncbi:MAG: hypothetical protein F4Y69_01815 [Chloroflexi bacterium]|nr:hypothetical protein [Chloroflexota bacterium]MYF22187.1 hypothetical protein [Chloroflexota bacterium]
MERFAGLLEQLPRRQGEMLRALHLAQEEMGWISRDAIRLIARHLRVSEAQVYGPATFYSEFRHSPPPRTLVTWCSGPSCRVVGGDRVRRIFEAEFSCRLGENTEDDALGLWLGQCNGTCERAPMVWVNGRVVGPLTMLETVKLARRLKDGEDPIDWPERPIKIAPATFVEAEATYGSAHGEAGEEAGR